MSDIAIRVESISKLYRIGETVAYKTLRDSIADRFAGVFKRTQPADDPSTAGQAHSRRFWAWKDVSFQVRRGEVVGLIGRNGAGKSTMLKVLARIVTPTKGRAEIHGSVGCLLEVGTGFHPELTGRENIYLNGAVLGMNRREIALRYDDIVEFSGVQKFLETPVKHYSSGMAVRLAFAVAAHLEPEVLLIDEVLAVGDTEFQKKCLGKMHEVAGQGRTVIYVSHALESVKSLCTRALLFKDGRIEADGGPDEVVAKYLGVPADAAAMR
jgi:lipopolysaccharide transport system ATP-binding protein